MFKKKTQGEDKRVELRGERPQAPAKTAKTQGAPEKVMEMREKPVKAPDKPAQSDEIRRSEQGEKEVKKSRRKIILLVSLALLLVAGGVAAAVLLLPGFLTAEEPITGMDDEESAEVSSENSENEEEEEAEKEEKPAQAYSVLTGMPVANEEMNKRPTFCVQVPNGTDGARPQAGLTDAGVIFEAIAERGITRFAAIFQGGDTAAIGPMRSLRLYYLQWDVPFDCTIVHDGGADDALAAVRNHKDFTGFSGFVWRSSANKKLNRRWNNEFTSGELLLKYNQKRSYGASNVKGFSRMLPDEAKREQIDELATNPLDIDTETDKATNEVKVAVKTVKLKFGNMPNYNPVYTYDMKENVYRRGYESGVEHKVYDCAGLSGKITPENVCSEKQLSPRVVIAMVVQQKRAADNYHENITTVGNGKAYIFQSGMVKEGSWRKASVGEQIHFYDMNGVEIKLAPGQTMVSAVPQTGSVSWE